jgi:hypothetical protein
MASGTPAAVATDAGALAEVAGDAAVQVPERTPEAWVRGIAEARGGGDARIEAGLRQAARHRWPQVAAAVREVLAG